MSYLEFDKRQLINLEYSLNKETLRTNRAGSFSCTTIINCNTRKYHGLLICPMENLDNENHVLLSTLDETIIQHNKEFHLAVHKYPGIFHPGHKYIREFESEPIPTHIFRVGGVEFKKEVLLVEEEERVLIRYTLLNSNSKTIIRLHPFLAFRNIHSLCKANMDVKTKYEVVKKGIKTRMYEAYPYLYMQLSKDSDYISAPDWFYNVEYPEEINRGYEGNEDLFVPGFFEFEMINGETIIFSAGLDEAVPVKLPGLFNNEIKKRTPRNNYENCLENSAQQFIVRKGNKTEIIAGFPWFNKRGRDTFIALPGLTISRGDINTCKAVLDTMSHFFSGASFYYNSSGAMNEINVDVPLWYIYAVQKYARAINKDFEVWKEYGYVINSILEGYKSCMNTEEDNNYSHLLYFDSPRYALTWMNAYKDNLPVTPRNGFIVEVNALWYNAVVFALRISDLSKDKNFKEYWKQVPEKIEKSFINAFWDSSKGYLADFVINDYKEWSVRPNMIFATSLTYSPLTDDMKHSILKIVEKELLTSRGLRTLTPKNHEYKGTYEGSVTERDSAYHQGTVWPWLLGHFCEAYLKINEKSGISLVKRLYKGFEEEMNKHGIGTISEIYDGNPPHVARGAMSYAPSVAELIRIKAMIKDFE